MRTERGVSNTITAGAVVLAIIIVAGVFYLVPGLVPGRTITVTTAPTTSTTSTTSTHKQYSMAVVLGGDETDLGFNYVAIQAANYITQTYGWNISVSRDVAYSNQGRVISSLAHGSYDLVWVVGNQFIGTTEAIANQSYKAGLATKFAQTPSYYQSLTPNIVLLDQSFQITGYYEAGVLAAKMTQTGAVGMIIGQWFPSQSMEFYAFEAGVNATNPAVKTYVRVAGTWSDANLGLQIAQSLIQTKHVDIIAQIADATGRGAFTAAQLYNATANGKQYHVSIIGTVADQASLAPNNVMTSVLMNTTAFITNVVQHIQAGTWSDIAGKDLFMNLGSLAPFHNYDSTIPASVKSMLATTVRQINSGAIVVHQQVTQNPPSDPA
ncbi:MAG TPA: BMP family ABC transporter substrate-binding protein [Nitrososphaerales archaeon]|nr:BMP family ABC transporter substrate-binding protein [Nitrososphaerales archaeon]